VIVDAAHNVASVQALLDTIRQGFDARQKILLFAATRDKDVAGLLRRLLAEFDHVVLTRYVKNPRGVPVPELNRLALRLTDRPIHSAPDPVSAWHLARQLGDSRDLICVTGSFLVAAEVRELILAELKAPRIAPGPCDAPCPPPLAESASQAGLPA
jgi:dihydrofolate synthase/folylpolyglutamate synthase